MPLTSKENMHNITESVLNISLLESCCLITKTNGELTELRLTAKAVEMLLIKLYPFSNSSIICDFSIEISKFVVVQCTSLRKLPYILNIPPDMFYVVA